MDLMGQWVLGMQGPSSTSGKGLAPEDIGIFSFPIVPGGKGKATDTLGGINGFLVTKTAPKETVDFLNFFSQEKYAKEAAATGGYIPVYKGAEAAIKDPLVKHLADDLAMTTYHQNFLRSGSRTLGRSGHQRYLGRGRSRRNEARGRRRRDSRGGRPTVESWSERSSRTSPFTRARSIPATR